MFVVCPHLVLLLLLLHSVQLAILAFYAFMGFMHNAWVYVWDVLSNHILPAWFQWVIN